MHRGSERALGTVVVAVLVGGGLAGCGAAAHSRHAGAVANGPHLVGAPPDSGRFGSRIDLRPMPVSPWPALSRSAPRSLRSDALPPVGATQRVNASGARLAVTLRRVIDPLRASGAELPAGTRAVGVVVQISSAGPRLYDSSATGDVSLAVSGGVVTPVLVTRGICRTPLDDFDRYITAGEDRVGCVAFAVADGATLDAVRFSPHAHRLGRLTWAP